MKYLKFAWLKQHQLYLLCLTIEEVSNQKVVRLKWWNDNGPWWVNWPLKYNITEPVVQILSWKIGFSILWSSSVISCVDEWKGMYVLCMGVSVLVSATFYKCCNELEFWDFALISRKTNCNLKGIKSKWIFKSLF